MIRVIKYPSQVKYKLYTKSQLHQMQDAHDFFLRLLNNLDDCGVGVNRVFGGKTIQRVVCQACNTSSDRKDPFLDLSLSFPVTGGGGCGGMMGGGMGGGGGRGRGGMMNGMNGMMGGRGNFRSFSMGKNQASIVELDALLDYYFREESLCGDNK